MQKNVVLRSVNVKLCNKQNVFSTFQSLRRRKYRETYSCIYIYVMKARFHENRHESYDRNFSVLENFNLTALIVVEVWFQRLALRLK
jgi:uncharacterized membrane protein